MPATFAKQRKYARHKAPKGLRVAWSSSRGTTTSRATVLGLGGLFLHTANPLPLGSVIEILFELKAGDVRARAAVRDAIPGKGMGLQFVQMETIHRSRWSQFLAQFELAESEDGKSVSPSMANKRRAPSNQTERIPRSRKQRSVLRCPLVASVEVVDLESGARLSARISELAVRGCHVDALNPFPADNLVAVRILRDHGVFEAKAKVVYSHGAGGMGLTFTEMSPDQRSLLEDWLAEIVSQRRLLGTLNGEG